MIFQFKLQLLVHLIILSVFLRSIQGEVELCTDGGQLLKITNDSCPFGVLFLQPQSADCIVIAGEDESAIMADVCQKEAFSAEKKTFQYIPEISPEMIEQNSSCSVIMAPMCNVSSKIVHPNSFIKHITGANFQFADESNDTNKMPVRDQTMRLFEYMMGLSRVDVDESLRVVLLLKKSFEIIKKFCPKAYLKTEFYEDVETAFLFMFNEVDSTKVKDVTLEEFETINRHLTDCLDQKNPFKYEGKRCTTYSLIQRVFKSGVPFSEFDTTNEDAFMKFDVATEATWGAIDFVHGLCYGTFRDHINSHHLYTRAMERLFTKEMLYRWKHRFIFQEHQNIWNHFFSANVKNALMNMDICIQASYLSTPFLHRLERPVDEGGPGNSTDADKPQSRKKRWAEPHALMKIEEVEGYCFQSKEEADEVIQGLCE